MIPKDNSLWFDHVSDGLTVAGLTKDGGLTVAGLTKDGRLTVTILTM